MTEPKNENQAHPEAHENAPVQQPATSGKRRIPEASAVDVVASFDTTAGIKNYSEDDEETP